MSILIKGMEMPKAGCHHMICIYADGTVSTGGRVYMAIPAANDEPVRNGRWLQGNMPTYGGYKCSVCGGNTVHYKANFCPNCGCAMDKDGD